jgi:glycosyltransferase involved in cell wall biosynthesis
VKPLVEHIAICTVGELFGGVERHVLGMIAGMAAHRLTPLLVLFHNGELAAQARALGIDPIIVSNRNLTLPLASRRLAHLFEQHAIGVVHVHGYKATVFCALAQRWYPFAMVKTEHGLPEPMARGAIRSLRNRLYYWLEAAAARMARATVCYVTADLRGHYVHAHAGLRSMVVPNGLSPLERTQFPRPPELHVDTFNLLTVGRLDRVKGHHLAIQAVAALEPEVNAHLHILGDGPSRSELATLAGSLGVAARVHLQGFQRNVYDYIAHCDALLMPSLHEGLPYTLLEAMALGIPVIASRVGGLAEVIEDGRTGLLLPPEDAPALAAAIRQLQRDAGLRARLGAAALEIQRSRYSLNAMTESYLRVYRDLQRQPG